MFYQGAKMPTQDEISRLITMLKQIKSQTRVIRLPSLGEQSNISLESIEKPIEPFRITINRKQRISGNYSFLEIHGNSGILLRLDIIGPPHSNPDGTEIPCPHIHIARDDYDDSWAYAFNPSYVDNFDNLISQLYEFMRHCNIINIDNFNMQISF